MPLFDYGCSCGFACDLFRRTEKRDDPVVCGRCGGQMQRKFSSFGVGGQHLNAAHYEFEKDAWEVATGERHATPADLKRWCDERGKQIVDKNWKPKPPPLVEDWEVEKALNDVYEQNHTIDAGNVGESQ